MSPRTRLGGSGAGFLCLLVAIAVVGAACQSARDTSGSVTGAARVQRETQTGPMPSQPPRTVYVEDFVLDYQHVQTDEGVRGRVGALQRVPRVRPQPDPAEQARKLVTLLSESLVADLTAAGIPAERMTRSPVLPADGWLLHGAFVEVDEGNRLQRAVIGFGSGASHMQVMVGVNDLARNPEAPFIIFGTVTDPSKLPGAAVSMNPYMAAARFVMEKSATEKDVKRTSTEIVRELLKYQEKFREQAESSRPAR
jgi:hypothetical protein